MKNAYAKPSFTDNFATAALLVAMFVSSLGALFASFDARAELAAVPTYTLDTIVVTAPRMSIEKLDTIVVVASRN